MTDSTLITGVLTVTTGTLAPTAGLTLISDSNQTAIISGAGLFMEQLMGNVSVQGYLGQETYLSYWYISSPVSCTFQQIVNNIQVVGWGAIYRLYQWSNVWMYDETDISQVRYKKDG